MKKVLVILTLLVGIGAHAQTTTELQKHYEAFYK